MVQDDTTLENAYVAYFDVLGFTSRFISGDLTQRYERLIGAIKEINDAGVYIFLLSDSIVIVSTDFRKVWDNTRSFYTWGILEDFWLRGAITQGNVTLYNVNHILEKGKIILPFMGEGYIKAYKLETMLNIAGIIIDDAIFAPGASNPDIWKDLDYVEYEEYLPKRGNEGKKRLLLPLVDSTKQIVDTMYFEEMLKSHVEDIDKYINTFCFYIRSLLEKADQVITRRFLDKLLMEFKSQGRRVLIPSKVVIIFLAVIDGLFARYRAKNHPAYASASVLELDISAILATLRSEGYLATFIDYLLEYDKKRNTSLYKDINSLRSG